MEHWRKVVFSRVEIWWNVGSKNGERSGWTTVHLAHRQVFHRWHRHRIEPFVKVTVILAQGEWSIAKDIGPFFKRCNARHRQTFLNWVNVYVFNIGSICIHGKNYSENLHSIKNTGNDLTLKQMFDISEKLIVGQSDEIFGVNPINWEDSSWKHFYLWLQRFMYFQILCCLGLESEPNIQCCLGTRIEWVQKFTTVQNFAHNWRRTDGIRVEYFPRFTSSSSAKSKSSWPKRATHHNSKDELSSCRCSMTSYEDLKTMSGNAMLTPRLCLNLQKDSQQDVGHSSDLGQK